MTERTTDAPTPEAFIEEIRTLRDAMIAVEQWPWPNVINQAAVASFAVAFAKAAVEKERERAASIKGQA